MHNHLFVEISEKWTNIDPSLINQDRVASPTRDLGRINIRDVNAKRITPHLNNDPSLWVKVFDA